MLTPMVTGHAEALVFLGKILRARQGTRPGPSTHLQIQDAAEVGAGAGWQQGSEVFDQRVRPAPNDLEHKQTIA